MFNFIYADYAERWSYGFQDPASPHMYALIDLHDRIIFYLVIILTVVGWVMISALRSKDHQANLHHGNAIEFLWTLSPAFILWAIGLPSLKLLYLTDEQLDAEVTVKAIGNQWMWEYSYGDYASEGGPDISFYSYTLDDDSLELGDLRQQAVDNNLVLPVNCSIRLLVTSNDVIHSFAVPSLALKMDALPGRQNSTGIQITRPSLFHGQCSELCGANHSFMAIAVEAVNVPSFLNFIESHRDA